MIYNNDEMSFFNNGRGGIDSGLWRPPIPANEQSKFNSWTSQSNKNPMWNTGMRQTPNLTSAQNHDKLNGLPTWNDPADSINGLATEFSGFGIYDKVEFPNSNGTIQWGQSEINQATPWDIDATPFNGGNLGLINGNSSQMVENSMNQWKSQMNSDFMKNGALPNGLTSQEKPINGYYAAGFDMNTPDLTPMMNGAIHPQQQWAGNRNFSSTAQPNMGMPTQQQQRNFPSYGIRPPVGNPPPMGMMGGGGPPPMKRPPVMPQMQAYGNGGANFSIGSFTPQQEPAVNEDAFWHDPNGDMRKWQRDTGTAIWGDASKQSMQKICRWTQAPDPEEEKHVETVALKDENGTPINPAWPELPSMTTTNPPPSVQSVVPQSNLMNQRPTSDGWMNPGNGFMGQNNQNMWPEQNRPLNGMSTNNFSGHMGQANGGIYTPVQNGMNDWARPPSTIANSMFGQNGNDEHFALSGMKPQNEPIVQKFADALRTAVAKGLLDMNILYNFSASSANGQLPTNIIYYIHHILGRVENLEQANQKAEILKHSTNTAQRNEYERLLLEIIAIKAEIAEICEKINGVISTKALANMPPPPKPSNITNNNNNSNLQMWGLPPPSSDSGANSTTSSRLIDDLTNFDVLPPRTMPELGSMGGGESIW
uniref:Uncharacterized protein n=1 Tax=Acrobeloides nanus TaxID=290746 RepID=A0A914DZD5_9BILA